MNYLNYIPKYQLPFEPIRHARADEAEARGMTVELLLALEKAQAEALKNQGVIIADKGDAYQNKMAAIKGNPKELQRQEEGKQKAYAEAGKAANAMIGLTMPSGWWNLTHLDNLLTEGQAAAMDLGAMALLGGAGLVKGAIGKKMAQKELGNTTAREIAEKSAAETARKNTIRITENLPQQSSKTSLAFFERPLAKLTEAEKLGIPKGDRGNLDRFQKEALNDLSDFILSGQYRLYPSLVNGEIKWGSRVNEDFLQAYVSPLMGSPYKGGHLLMKGEGYSRPRFTILSNKLNGGEASFDTNLIVLTSPKRSAEMGENSLYFSIDNAPQTLPKEGVKSFWEGLLDVIQPGNYVSGDISTLPLGSRLIREYTVIGKPRFRINNSGQKELLGMNTWQNVIDNLMRKTKWKSHTNGLSVDSYMALLKLGNRPGYSLRFSPDGMIDWNTQGIENKFIQDLYEQAVQNPSKQLEFLKAFHDWVTPYGGMDAKVVNGLIIIPHPYIYKKKQGGSLNYLNYIK